MEGVPEMVREMGGDEQSENVMLLMVVMEESEDAFTSNTEPLPDKRVMEEKITVPLFVDPLFRVLKLVEVVEMERREEEVSVIDAKVTSLNTRLPDDASMSVVERFFDSDPLKRM